MTSTQLPGWNFSPFLAPPYLRTHVDFAEGPAEATTASYLWGYSNLGDSCSTYRVARTDQRSLAFFIIRDHLRPRSDTTGVKLHLAIFLLLVLIGQTKRDTVPCVRAVLATNPRPLEWSFAFARVFLKGGGMDGDEL